MRAGRRVVYVLVSTLTVILFIALAPAFAQVATTTPGQSPTGTPDPAVNSAESFRVVGIALVGGAMYLLVRGGQRVRARRRKKAQTG